MRVGQKWLGTKFTASVFSVFENFLYIQIVSIFCCGNLTLDVDVLTDYILSNLWCNIIGIINLM